MAPRAQAPDPRPGLYYVTAIDNGRRACLLGPYPTHQDALDRVEVGRKFAEKVDDRAAFYAYGTARMPEDHPRPPRGALHKAEERGLIVLPD